MKIIYDHKIFWNQKYGGISRYFVNLFKNLENLGLDYKIIAPFYKNNFLKHEIRKEKITGIHLNNVIPKTSFLLSLYNDFYFNYSIKKIKPDIIHTTYYNSFINKNKTPLVTTVYDLIHEKNKVTDSKYNLIKKDVLDKSDQIICISNKTQEDLIEIYGISNDKISVIYLGSDHLINNIDIPYNITQKPFLIFIGSRKKYKNFSLLLKCISLSEKIKNEFDLVVFGSEKINNQEKIYINELKLSPMKIYFENGDDIKLSNLLKQSTCFIFPSLQEGFGLPILESMRSQCPVFCSDIDVFKEIAADSAEYFNPSDIDEMKYKLENLVFSTSRLENLKKLGHKRSLKFTWRECAIKTIDVYKKITF
tara:strand:- start:662 stop:1753 length:1092 start_codon:yes stop_codon:yes gene_type:complete